MGDPAAAMRDPIFYPWHTNVDNLFDSYKKALKPYQPHGVRTYTSATICIGKAYEKKLKMNFRLLF
jgi:hypothetical protein